MEKNNIRVSIDVNAEKLRTFDLILTMKGTNRANVLRALMDKYIEDNKHELENILKK